MREVVVWPSRGPVSVGWLHLAQQAGGSGLVRYLQAVRPPSRVAYAHGQKHDLWWEFPLACSFRWQAHLHGLPPQAFRRRRDYLAAGLGLTNLLERTVEDLTPAQRSRANLAVALLAGPDMLVWEEPFLLLPRLDRRRTGLFVRNLCRSESVIVVAVAEAAPGLRELAELPQVPLTAVP